MRKSNKNYKQLFIFFMLVLVSVFAFGITKVFSQNFGEGNYCIKLEFDPTNPGMEFEFPYTSVTVNGDEWTEAKKNENIYCTSNNKWTIIVLAGKNADYENEWPHFNTPGGFDQIGNVTEVPNPDDNPNVTGDEYMLTMNLNNWEFNGDPNNEPTPIEGYYDVKLTTGGPITNPSHEEVTNVTISISGDELEYHYVESEPDKADVTYFKFSINGGTEEEHLVPFRFGNANYTHNNNPEPNNVSSVTTINPIEYAYPYDGSGEVEFCVNGGGTDEYTSLIINNHDYTNQVPHSKTEHWAAMDGWAQMFCFNIPYSETYDVSVTGEKVPDDYIIPGFGWNYLSSERSQDVTPENEGNFAHGTLRFVSATATIDNEELEFNSVAAFNNYRYHGTGQIFQWTDGNKNYPEEERYWSWGSCQLPVGTTLTVDIVPDRGYQLTRLAVSQNGFQATGVPGRYTITLTEQNFNYDPSQNLFDLNPTFEAIDATAVTDSTAVQGVHIDVVGGDDAFATGTPKLQVSDVASMSPEREGNFTSVAEEDGYTINNYLELDLYNTIYKGGKTDGNNNYLSWDTPVHELDSNATINLELKDQLEGSEVALVHEVRDDQNQIVGYDVIEGNYNANTKVVSFETNGFSTYAVAYKGDAPVVNNKHNVIFNTTGGSPIDSVEVDHGQKVAKPEDPQNGEKVFGGWYLEAQCEHAYDFNSPVESDLELFAQWLDKHRIDFDTRTEQGMDPVFVTHGQKLERPQDPIDNEGRTLVGWFLDEECNSEFDFNTIIEQDYTLHAKWQKPLGNYTVGDDDLSVSFTDEVGHTFRIEVMNYYGLTAEQLEAAGIDQAEYDEVFNMVINATKSKGEMLAFLEINVYDEDDHEIHEPLQGTFHIKIALTEEMKKFNSFKLVYMNDDMSTGEEITLSVNGNYLEGDLTHLSNYSLLGSTVNNSSNPKTGDNIINYLIVLLISALGLGGLIYLKKNKVN